MRAFIIMIRATWLTISIIIITLTLKRLTQLESMYDISELISVMTYGMILISLPLGIVFAVVFLFIDTFIRLIPISIDNIYITTTAIWLFFWTGGYIQWFYLIDKIIKKKQQNNINHE